MMLPLHLNRLSGPLSLLVIGAHPDDIEIGAGGTLLTLAESAPVLKAHYLVLTGTADRQLEARQAARAFLPGVDLSVDLHDLPDGHVPSAWSQVKDILDATAESFQPDVIIAPSRLDAHQDHRTIGEIVPRVFATRCTSLTRYRSGTGTCPVHRCTSRCPWSGPTARWSC